MKEISKKSCEGCKFKNPTPIQVMEAHMGLDVHGKWFEPTKEMLSHAFGKGAGHEYIQQLDKEKLPPCVIVRSKAGTWYAVCKYRGI